MDMSVKEECKVSSVEELLAAARDERVKSITVVRDLADLPSVRLAPGQSLRGPEPRQALRFGAGQDGVQLSSDNIVSGLRLVCDVDRRALFNDTSVPDLRRIELGALSIGGVVHILAKDQVRG